MKSLLLMLCLLVSGSPAFSQAKTETDAVFTEEEEKKIEFSGWLDAKYTLYGMRRDSPFYRLSFFRYGNLPEYLSRYSLEFYFNGDYQGEATGLHIRTFSAYDSDLNYTLSLYELYGEVPVLKNTMLQAGKKTYNWGKGYAFNPAGYVNPQKDPELPENTQAGLLSLNLEMIKSFRSEAWRNLGLNLIVIPPAEDINDKYARLKYTEAAFRASLLILEMDLDLMGYYGVKNPSHAGMDFAANLLSNMEVHGELSYSRGAVKKTVIEGRLSEEKKNTSSYLLGFRFLTGFDMTVIGEYYHNGAGMSAGEFGEYYNFIHSITDTGAQDAMARAQESGSAFQTMTLMRDYVYIKISQPEPFNFIYFTPSVFAIINTADGSILLAMPLSYKPVMNFELLLTPALFTGGDTSEFGSKSQRGKIEFLGRFYF